MQGHYNMIGKERQMIELHSFHDDESFVVNSQKINLIRPYSTGSTILVEDYGKVNVKENMFTVMQMIVDAKFAKKVGENND